MEKRNDRSIEEKGVTPGEIYSSIYKTAGLIGFLLAYKSFSCAFQHA
jgi:hypothetical protein